MIINEHPFTLDYITREYGFAWNLLDTALVNKWINKRTSI
jgi:hypothetical protein